MIRKFITYCIIFFIPVLIGYYIIETLTLNLPTRFKINQELINTKRDSFETMILGSSQMKDAINPEWLDSPTINLASSSQHHDSDFKLMKTLIPKFNNLKTVVLEVSYSHFELPHNKKNFWKNPLYLKYYNVNAFERTPHIDDRLIYLKNPSLYSKLIYTNYITKNKKDSLNKYAFYINNYNGTFKELNYEEDAILSLSYIKINTVENLKIFKTNSQLFFEIIDYLRDKNLNIIICKVPMYKTYLTRRNTSILKRRDSILKLISQKYAEIIILNKEEDTINYQVLDFINQSHLNPDGAKIFTEELNTVLNQIENQ